MTPPTEDELNDIAVQLLPRGTAYGITGVSHTQFSLARHYGGVTWGGHHYTYFPELDQLWRDDVLRTVSKMRRQAKAEPAVSQHQEPLL